EAAPLDHESGGDAVEERVVVVLVLDVFQEVLHRDRRLLLVQLDLDRAHRRLHDDDGVGGRRGTGQERQADHREQQTFHARASSKVNRPSGDAGGPNRDRTSLLTDRGDDCKRRAAEPYTRCASAWQSCGAILRKAWTNSGSKCVPAPAAM